MLLKLLLPLTLVVALALFAGCGAATDVLQRGPVPADQPAPKLLPSALAENNWRTTTANGLPPDEVAVGDYGNFKVFAVKFISTEAAANFIDQSIGAVEHCGGCARDFVFTGERGYLKYRGPDLGFTLGGEAITQPFIVWNNGQWVFAVVNTGADDWRDRAVEEFSY